MKDEELSPEEMFLDFPPDERKLAIEMYKEDRKIAKSRLRHEKKLLKEDDKRFRKRIRVLKQYEENKLKQQKQLLNNLRSLNRFLISHILPSQGENCSQEKLN